VCQSKQTTTLHSSQQCIHIINSIYGQNTLQNSLVKQNGKTDTFYA